jgi:hypothetical protein
VLRSTFQVLNQTAAAAHAAVAAAVLHYEVLLVVLELRC